VKNGKPTFIDLFAGAGGLSEGFIRAGYEPIAHVEMDTAACNTLKTRIAYHYLKSQNRYPEYASYLKGEITRKELYALIPAELLGSVINLPINTKTNAVIHEHIKKRLGADEVELIVGGPPCQAYSLVGRARSADGMKYDSRNHLYKQYAKYLEKYKPKMFVFENVLGLKSASGGKYLRAMEKLFLEKGYAMKLFTVEADKFGVLQKRKRVIILGWKKTLTFEVPDLGNINETSACTVSALLSDLPKIKAGKGVDKYLTYASVTNDYLTRASIRNGIDVLTQHVARPHTLQDKKIYKIAVQKWNSKQERLNYNDLPEHLKTHENRTSFFDRFKVVGKDLTYSQTVVAHIAKDGHYYIHPDAEQNRSITIREAARLQSFPDDYYFEGVKDGMSRTAAFKQIGNAVPPLLSYKVAESLKNMFND
jgi:DNA (cytosine-5)-methyltransferase 1